MEVFQVQKININFTVGIEDCQTVKLNFTLNFQPYGITIPLLEPPIYICTFHVIKFRADVTELQFLVF